LGIRSLPLKPAPTAGVIPTVSPKAKNYLILLLAATTTASGLIAWNANQRLDTLHAELRQATIVTTALKRRPAPPAETTPAPTPPAKPDPASASEPPPPPDESAPPKRPRTDGRPNFSALMANPEFAKAMNLQQRGALDGRYADLFKKLKLPSADLEKLKNLLVERQTARMDVMATAREQGLDPRTNREELRQLTADAQAEVDANIKTTLGPAVFDQYQNYEATLPQRTLVSQLDQRLSYTAAPLTSTQTDYLINALAPADATRAPDPGPIGPGNWTGGNRPAITDTVIQQAQSVLTPDQLTALKQLQTEQQAQQQLRDLMRTGAGNTPARPARN